MKYCIAALTLAILLSSCLKESIPEAMLKKQHGTAVPARFSYKLNGNPVTLTIDDVRNQITVPYAPLGCTKVPGRYEMFAMTEAGGFSLFFFTDSLAVGAYNYTTGDVGEMYVLDYFNQSEFLHAATDRVNINITSHSNGYINGTFTALLTPLVDGGTNPYIFGTASSINVTEGSFTNVPVFY
jgi:hypothetical protein